MGSSELVGWVRAFLSNLPYSSSSIQQYTPAAQRGRVSEHSRHLQVGKEEKVSTDNGHVTSTGRPGLVGLLRYGRYACKCTHTHHVHTLLP